MSAVDPVALLDAPLLARLRAGYCPEAMVAANVAATERAAPELAAFGHALDDAFYGAAAREVLLPRERELALVSVLVQAGSALSLAVHLYWALMEGVEPAALRRVIGLAACYAGFARLSFGLFTFERLACCLHQLPEHESSSERVLGALITELGRPT